MNPMLKALLKGWAVVALIIAAVALLTGCGGGDPEPDQLLPTVSCTAGVCK